ncbi:hypothetical protein [Brevibacillus sp. 179-C9.3 HS]|uniref:hypothetical protein n=1 Tax=unclassified Brevibacillus TaxID=2684853 RepID=UPI00399FF094
MELGTLLRFGIPFIAAILTSASLLTIFFAITNKLREEAVLFRMNRKRFRSLAQKADPQKSNWKLVRKIDMLLHSTMDANETTVYKFLMIEGVIFAISFISIEVGSNIFGSLEATFSNYFSAFVFKIAVSSVLTAAPVLILFVRLRLIRIQGGYDLAETSGLLLTKYRKNNGRMYETLLETADAISNVNIQRRLRKIAKAARIQADEYQLRHEIEVFMYSIDTTFAKNIGLAIQKSIVSRINIETSLEMADRALQANIQMMDDEKSANSDIIHLAWLHPIAFPVSLMGLVYLSTFQRAYHHQFETEAGRFWFLASIISILLSVVSAIWFRKPKNDI